MASSSTTSTGGVNLSPSDFLQLFVTQMQYQDPTAPIDPSQMMNSLAQMTTVQDLTQVNQDFQQSFATELIGSQVTFISAANGQSSTGQVQSAQIQNGQAGVVVGGQFVPVSAVTQIAPAPTSAQTTTGQ
jgi:flagellar basal-body rod modification protein FlgD